MRSEECAEAGELNSLAVEWIDRVDSELGRYLSASSRAEFQYDTNLTTRNQQQVPAIISRLYTGGVRENACNHHHFIRPIIQQYTRRVAR